MTPYTRRKRQLKQRILRVKKHIRLLESGAITNVIYDRDCLVDKLERDLKLLNLHKGSVPNG